MSESGPGHAGRGEQAVGAPGPPVDERPSGGGPTPGRLGGGGRAGVRRRRWQKGWRVRMGG